MSSFDFDCTYSAITGEHVGGIYVPTVEADTAFDAEGFDVLIDGNPDNLSGEWRAIIGKTGQYSYNGCIMHPSETADDEAVREWVREAGGDVFAIVAVEAPCTEGDPCFLDDHEYCRENGCDAAPAGWTVIYQAAGE